MTAPTVLKPRVFVASSAEGLPVANAIQENLDFEAEMTVWPQGVFGLSDTAIDSLLREVATSDFAVFVFTPDDITLLRGDKFSSVRDNVLFELGLFIGKLGKARSFIVLPRGQDQPRLATDLAGLTPATYEPHRADGNLTAALGMACQQIRRAITREGGVTISTVQLQSKQEDTHTPDFTTALVARLARAIGPRGLLITSLVGDNLRVATRNASAIARSFEVGTSVPEGVRHVRDLTQEMDDQHGEGAKLAAILFGAMLADGVDAIQGGTDPHKLIEGMSDGVAIAKRVLLKGVTQTNSIADVVAVASTAAASRDVGTLVAEALKEAGKDGIVTIEEGRGTDTTLSMSEGAQFPGGYVSPDFARDALGGILELSDCYLLVTTERVESIHSILRLLEGVATTKRPLVIVAPEFSEDVVATLLVNFHKGTVAAVAVRAGGTGARKRDNLEDLATVTGALFVAPERGVLLDTISMHDLGRAKKVQLDGEELTIVSGHGSEASIDTRANALRSLIERATSDFDREILYQRVGRLQGAVATIEVGGLTPADRFEVRYQFYSALHASRRAIEGGFLPGGGAPYLYASRALSDPEYASSPGLQVVRSALTEPLRRLVSTTTTSPDTIVLELLEKNSNDLGFNVEKNAIDDLRTSGVLDPAIIVVAALDLAYSHVRQLLLADNRD